MAIGRTSTSRIGSEGEVQAFALQVIAPQVIAPQVVAKEVVVI
jgi:hypothetical protein